MYHYFSALKSCTRLLLIRSLLKFAGLSDIVYMAKIGVLCKIKMIFKLNISDQI